MWTSTLELSTRRVLLTQLLGRVWHGAYFASFAPLQVQNLPRQSLPASGWVRVRNRLSGVCGSDFRLIYLDGDFRIAPAALPGHRLSYPGHEVVGEVIEVGDDVQHLHVGDRVVLQYGPNCISTGLQPPCRLCAAGNYNLCERGNLPDPQPIGGGWSEEMLLHEQQLFRISPEMSDEQAVLLEPTAVAIHAVLRRLPQPGDQVLILGAGTIGLLILQAIRALSPQAIVSVMARYAFQVEQATRMGATNILYPQDRYQDVGRVTGAELYTGMLGNKMLLGGYDLIYDTIGSKQTIHDSLRWTRADGTVVLVGINLHTMHLDLTPIWYQEIDLIGSLGHGMETWPVDTFKRRSTFTIAAEMLGQGQINAEKLISHRFALNNYREALSTATNKARSRAIKVVFDYALQPASVVPNVRAAARQRRPVTTTAAWPQEEQSAREGLFWSPAPDEDFIRATPPIPEPIELPTSTQQNSIAKTEQPPSSADEEIDEEHPALEDQSPQSAITEVEQPPSSADEEPPALEDQSQNITTSVSKQRRYRQSARSQKTTEDVQTSSEANGNSVGTNQLSDTLEK